MAQTIQEGVHVKSLSHLVIVSAFSVTTLATATFAKASQVDIDDFGNLGVVSPGQFGTIILPGNQDGFVFEELQGILPAGSSVTVDAFIPGAPSVPLSLFQMFKPVDSLTFSPANTVYLSSFNNPNYSNGATPSQYSVSIASSGDHYFTTEINNSSGPVGFYTELLSDLPSSGSLASFGGAITYFVSSAEILSAPPVPLPSALLLLGSAIAGMGALTSRRTRTASSTA